MTGLVMGGLAGSKRRRPSGRSRRWTNDKRPSPAGGAESRGIGRRNVATGAPATAEAAAWPLRHDMPSDGGESAGTMPPRAPDRRTGAVARAYAFTTVEHRREIPMTHLAPKYITFDCYGTLI